MKALQGAGPLVGLWIVLSLPAAATAGEAVATSEAQAKSAEAAEEKEASRAEPPAYQFGERVTVTGTREERPLQEIPGAVAVVGEEELRQGRGEALDSYLNQTPGVVAQSNDGASDVKLSIRGFGARSTFGVRDVLVLVDGVPITDADGFTRLDQIDLAAAERLEVVKGPASALYGNAAFGGVINVITRHGSLQDREARFSAEAGELGFSKALLSLGGGSLRHRVAYALHASRAELTEFRDHNDTETRRLNGSLDWFTSEATTVRALLNLSQMRDEIPGSLNRQQFEADPEQVRPVFELFDHRRDDDRYRLGGVLEHQRGADHTFEGRLFVLTRDLDHPIFQVIDQQGLRFLGGARYGRALGNHRLVVGIDLDREDVDNQRFRNVFGDPGELLLSADEVVENAGLYAQAELALAGDLSLTVGARFDHIRFAEDDRLRDPVDLSDERGFERLSPKLGVLWQPRPALGLFLNLATAFQVPTKSELAATVGDTGFNPDLEPQVARHGEIGVRGTVGRRVRYEASVFRTDVDDEILPFTRIQEVTIFGNVGETRHRGAELALEVLLHPLVELGLGYGWSDNVLTRFGTVSGNTIPGHPEHRGTVRLATRRARGVNGVLTFERVGSVFLNDANTETEGAYGVLGAAVRYDFERWSVFVRGTNLTDEHYAAWIAVNDPQGNYFLPAAGRAVTAGFDLSF
jgi:iron complex outermembrane receptor protein